MIDPYLDREGLTVLPLRLETITVGAGEISQLAEVGGGNHSGGFSTGNFDGKADLPKCLDELSTLDHSLTESDFEGLLKGCGL